MRVLGQRRPSGGTAGRAGSRLHARTYMYLMRDDDDDDDDGIESHEFSLSLDTR